jgi:hypothetical protein
MRRWSGHIRHIHISGWRCLKGESGKYYLGCNIENGSYTPTNCAERTARFKAVSEGEHNFESIVIDAPARVRRLPAAFADKCCGNSARTICPVVFADGKRN